MEFDVQIAVERVQAEGMRLFDMPKSVDADYFQRYRTAVQTAAGFFKDGAEVEPVLLNELSQMTQILRNESSVFEGRASACLEMAEWLETTYATLTR